MRCDDAARPLPCPFCGAEAKRYEVGSVRGWRFEHLDGCYIVEGDALNTTFISDKREKTAEHWNARPTAHVHDGRCARCGTPVGRTGDYCRGCGRKVER